MRELGYYDALSSLGLVTEKTAGKEQAAKSLASVKDKLKGMWGSAKNVFQKTEANKVRQSPIVRVGKKEPTMSEKARQWVKDNPRKSLGIAGGTGAAAGLGAGIPAGYAAGGE